MGLHLALNTRPAWWEQRVDFLISYRTQVSAEALEVENLDILQFARERNLDYLRESIRAYGWMSQMPDIDENSQHFDWADPLSQGQVLIASVHLPHHTWFSTSHHHGPDSPGITMPEGGYLLTTEQRCTCATCLYVRPVGRRIEHTIEGTFAWRQVGEANGWLRHDDEESGYFTEVQY